MSFGNHKKGLNNLFNKNLLLLLLIAMSLAIAYLSAVQGIIVAAAFICFCIGVCLFTGSMLNVQFGIFTIVICAFFIMGIYRIYDFDRIPIAIIMEIFILAVFFGVLIQLHKNKDFKLDYNIVNILLLAWLGYHFIQLFNPNAVSRIAWFYAVRNTVMIIVVYFIIRNGITSERFVANILKTWIFLTLIGALYCIKQEYFGFYNFETRWIHADPERFGFIYTWGRIRKFSFFASPMVLGIMLAYTAVLCFILMTGPFKTRNRIFLGVAGCIMIWAMLFTGTRTATVLLPVGLLFYAIITFKKEVLIGVGTLMAIGTIIVMMPTSNPNLYIMKSAFRGSEDASMNVRLNNQEIIQPYIRSNPIGYGVGSTGGWGAQFSPHTFIGSFPPDSEYVRVAIELGWIGLLYFCILLFFILKTGIDNYFNEKNPRIRVYYIGILTVTFMTVVAMYPQEAIRIHPLGIIFALCIALLTKMNSLTNIKSI